MTIMVDIIDIDYEYDDDGNEIEGCFVVELNGRPADEYGLSREYCSSLVNAHSFAEEVSELTGTPITWSCTRPAWA